MVISLICEIKISSKRVFLLSSPSIRFQCNKDKVRRYEEEEEDLGFSMTGSSHGWRQQTITRFPSYIHPPSKLQLL